MATTTEPSSQAARIDNPFRALRRSPEPAAAAPALPLRPMTGYEEEVAERQASDANTARLCNEILARCLAPPGADSSAALAQVRAMLVPERDAALVQLRRISLGDAVRTELRCPRCCAVSEAEFSLAELPLPPLPGRRPVDLTLPGGARASLRLPTAGDQEELLEARLETASERKTFLLARALLHLGEREGPFDFAVVRALPVPARNAMEAALEAALPDLDLSMAARCAECSHGFQQPLDVADFFLPR
jgi:hypothetical protein